MPAAVLLAFNLLLIYKRRSDGGLQPLAMLKPFWKISPRQLTRSQAWVCAVVNLLLCPGLGTVFAGYRAGIAQCVLAFAGVAMTLAGMLWFVGEFIETLEFPAAGGRSFWIGIGGAGMFVLSWLWALASTVQIFRKTSTAAPASIPPLPPR